MKQTLNALTETLQRAAGSEGWDLYREARPPIRSPSGPVTVFLEPEALSVKGLIFVSVLCQWSCCPVILWSRLIGRKQTRQRNSLHCRFRENLPVDVYGVGEGVAEGSTVGLGVGVPNGGVGVGETSDPGVGLGSAERCGL
jgi:hypothetical protein